MRRINGIAGSKFGRLNVGSFSGKRSESGEFLWNCYCECGSTVLRTESELRGSTYPSCGCKLSDVSEFSSAIAVSPKSAIDDTGCGEFFNVLGEPILCRQRGCPTCEDRSAKSRANSTQSILRRYSHLTWFWVSLPCAKVKIGDLRKAIVAANADFLQLLEIDRFQKIQGYARYTSVRYSSGQYSVSIVAILAAPKSFSSSHRYISQADFADMWAQARDREIQPGEAVRKLVFKGSSQSFVGLSRIDLGKFPADDREAVRRAVTNIKLFATCTKRDPMSDQRCKAG
jgi:Replication protein